MLKVDTDMALSSRKPDPEKVELLPGLDAIKFYMLTFFSLKELLLLMLVSKSWREMAKTALIRRPVALDEQKDFTQLLINLIEKCEYGQIQRHIELGIQCNFQLNECYQNTVEVRRVERGEFMRMSIKNPTPLLLATHYLDYNVDYNVDDNAELQIIHSLLFKPGFDLLLCSVEYNQELVLSKDADSADSLVILTENGPPLVIVTSDQLKKAREAYTPILIKTNNNFFVCRANSAQWQLINCMNEFDNKADALNELNNLPFSENEMFHCKNRQLSFNVLRLVYGTDYIGPEERISSYTTSNNLVSQNTNPLILDRSNRSNRLISVPLTLAYFESQLLRIRLASSHLDPHHSSVQFLTSTLTNLIKSIYWTAPDNRCGPLIHDYLSQLLSIQKDALPLRGISRLLSPDDVAILNANPEFMRFVQRNVTLPDTKPNSARLAITYGSLFILISLAICILPPTPLLILVALVAACTILILVDNHYTPRIVYQDSNEKKVEPLQISLRGGMFFKSLANKPSNSSLPNSTMQNLHSM